MLKELQGFQAEKKMFSEFLQGEQNFENVDQKFFLDGAFVCGVHI